MNPVDWNPNRVPLERELDELVLKMEGSLFVIGIFTGKVDAKVICEIGTAVMLDKPIILLASGDAPIPGKLRKVVDEIVHLPSRDLKDHTAATEAKLTAAIDRILKRLKVIRDTAAKV